MKPFATLMAILFIASATARAQVVPAATGPAGLPLSGALHYHLSYSQMVQFYGGQTAQNSILSGEATYKNSSPAYPFSLMYSGGNLWNISGSSGESGVFQHMLASQGFVGRKQSFTLRDDASYLPEAPTTGFSGIPGVGNLPGLPIPPTLSVLTLNTPSVLNATSANYTHNLGHAISFGGNGSYQILRFPDGNGLEMDSWQAGPQITRRLNALNSISAQYTFSHISYPGYTFTMDTQSALFGDRRTWSRRFQTNVSAGPQWVRSSDSATIPTSINLTVNATATYTTPSTSATLSYFRTVAGGSGVETQFGIETNTASASLMRKYGRNLDLSATGAYMRTQGLQLGLSQIGVINAEYGGVAATRRWGRYIIVFANYTAIHQSSSSVIPANAINGLSQVVSFGVGYSPRETHFRK